MTWSVLAAGTAVLPVTCPTAPVVPVGLRSTVEPVASVL